MSRKRFSPKRVLVLGAGPTGIGLAHELESRSEVQLVGILDDGDFEQSRSLGRLQLLGRIRDLPQALRDFRIDGAAICMPEASRAEIRSIVSHCQAASVKCITVPSLAETVLERLSFNEGQVLPLEDLLGRASIEYLPDRRVRESFQSRRMLITGAAGSIGLELCRQLSRLRPAGLLLLDQDENGLYEAGLEIRELCPGCQTDVVVADVRDQGRLKRVFERWAPQAVFHAAAYKHVPMMERDPSEAILTNVLGTRNMAELSVHHQAESFVLLSSDKAVNPSSVMGASKRVAEMIVQQEKAQGAQTRFCCVRFGNVLGSRASVVPIFQKRIAQGKSLQVTHPEVRRYFMTIAEAVQLVIQAGAMGKDGEIFLLDMGDPVRILDLAHEMIRLSGLVAGRDIAIEFTGLRAGERLYEELLIDQEKGDRSTKHPKIFATRSEERSWPQLDAAVRELEAAARAGDDAAILGILHSLDIGYRVQQQPQPATAP